MMRSMVPTHLTSTRPHPKSCIIPSSSSYGHFSNDAAPVHHWTTKRLPFIDMSSGDGWQQPLASCTVSGKAPSGSPANRPSTHTMAGFAAGRHICDHPPFTYSGTNDYVVDLSPSLQDSRSSISFEARPDVCPSGQRPRICTLKLAVKNPLSVTYTTLHHTYRQAKHRLALIGSPLTPGGLPGFKLRRKERKKKNLAQ